MHKQIRHLTFLQIKTDFMDGQTVTRILTLLYCRQILHVYVNDFCLPAP